MPNIWVCRTGGDYTKVFFREKFAGFRLHKVDPLKFRNEAEMSEQIVDDVTTEHPDLHFSGKTFGRQIWDIAHNVQVGDWIYLDHPNIAEKPRDPNLPKGKRNPQRSFIVAAGIVSGPYRYAARHEAYHQVPVDWKWKGQVLIDYGFQSQIFVSIDGRHPKVRTDLINIWTPEKPTAVTPSTGTSATKPASEPQTLDRDWEEGSVVLRQHLAIERSPAAAKFAKETARKRGKGVIHCDACGVAPAKAYGEEIIDAHHIVPLSDTKGMARTPTADDFAMLCPTCHRAVHRVLSKGHDQGRDAIEAVRRTVFSRR